MENLTEGILISKHTHNTEQKESDIKFKNKEIGKLFDLISIKEG